MLRLLLLLVTACGRVGFDPRGDCALALDDAEVNPSSRVVLAATGGSAPIRYAPSGPGEVDGDRFFSPPEQAQTTITARDAAGCTATATITTIGRTLFYIAGTANDVPTKQVWRGTDPLRWTRIGDFPVARTDAAVAVFHDAIWYVGGSDDLTPAGHVEVWSSTDGDTWTARPPFPAAVADAVAIGWRDQLWVLGGHGAPGSVYSSADGMVWTKHADLPIPSHGGEVIVLDDRLVYMGGHDDVSYYDTELATDDGEAWTTIGTLPSKREFQATAQHAGQIVFAGGTDASTYLSDSYHSTDARTWTPGGALPAEGMYGQMRFIGDRFYFVGGTGGGDIASSADGVTWRAETSGLPHSRYAGALVEFTPR